MIKQLNKKQESKLNSFRSTEQYVDENIAVINKIPAFLANFNKIKAKIADILQYAQMKSASLTGIAAGKSNSVKRFRPKPPPPPD